MTESCSCNNWTGRFSTHILTWRMTGYFCHEITYVIFSTHILTRRMTVVVLDVGCRWTFQLTSSQGGWRIWKRIWWYARLFNSHPHKEDDHENDYLVLFTYFSTHILTRRMTTYYHLPIYTIHFSTHILTRRMTYPCCPTVTCRCFSTHILTRRMTESWPWEKADWDIFNSHPHKEDD